VHILEAKDLGEAHGIGNTRKTSEVRVGGGAAAPAAATPAAAITTTATLSSFMHAVLITTMILRVQ
jgi:hypothetical protein